MANWTENRNFTSTLRQANIIPAGVAVSYGTLNVFLSIIASLGNVLILIALHKASSIHPPTKLLFQCLAATDLLIGLVSQPLFVILLLNAGGTKINFNFNSIQQIIQINCGSSLVLCGTSIATSTAISVDRLLALKLGLRYKNVVTLKRTRALTVCIWLSGISVGFIYFFWIHLLHIFFAIAVVLSVVFVSISIFCYTKIIRTLQQHQAKVQDRHNQQGMTPQNIGKYKKTVSSIAWVQLALVVCYVPFLVSIIVIKVNGWTDVKAEIVWASTGGFLYLNSSLNPILYCWKIKEVRQLVSDTLGQFCCSSNLHCLY